MKRVIVQDIDYDLLETLTIILEEASYEVMSVRTCKAVISQIILFDPHVVLLDFRLSGHEAIRNCNLIKKNFPDLPVVALSCNTNIQNEYFTAGFDDYISKPFDIDELILLMDKVTCL